MRKAFLAVVFAVFLIGGAFLPAKGNTLPRAIQLEVADPRRSFDANAQAWISLNQGFALALEETDKLGLSRHALGRAAQLGAAIWSNAMLRYYSHESAHEYIFRNSGIDVQSRPVLSQMTSSYVPGFYYPAWQKCPAPLERFDDDQLLFAIAAGLNQDEWNARLVWRRNLEQGGNYYDALSFLLPKLRDVFYLLGSRSDEQPFAPAQNVAQLSQVVHDYSPELYDDVNLYRLALLNRGIQVSNRTLLQQALAADLMTGQTWNSLFSLVQFVLGGDSQQSFLSHLPLVSTFWTPTGPCFQAEFPLRLQRRLLLIDIGVKKNEPETFRVGAELNPLPLFHSLEAEPFFSRTFYSGRRDGFSLGVNVVWAMNDRFSWRLQLAAMRDDLIENVVKGEKSGVTVRLGFKKAFLPQNR